MLFFLRIIEYLLAAIAIGAVISIKVYADNQVYLLYAVIVLVSSGFLFILNRNSLGYAEKAAQRRQLEHKAELYTSLLNNSNSLDNNTIVPARTKALEYSQDLIDDYKKARNLARTLYYVLQLSTIVFSGVTPILVLVDKLETGNPLLKWLPVICPAIASIVASIVTSFPFQKNWVAANKAVELLEAEQEKFILGITSGYRCYDIVGDVEQQQKVSQCIEEFIIQVNNIHLKQIQTSTDSQQDKKESTPSESSSSAPNPA
jgi:hypothetical protein